MALVNPAEFVKRARAEGWAVPAFNANGATYDIARAILEAAQEMRSPIIMQSYEPNVEYRGFKYFTGLAEHLIDELGITVPVALQVDHGESYESFIRSMLAGFSSFMIDASSRPLEENIAISRKVVETAHIAGMAVEAEVGNVKGNEPVQKEITGRVEVPERPSQPPVRTEPADLVSFLEAVDVDMLAVSVGTTHGVYRNQDNIDLKLLAELTSLTDVPLVQHGTCGISTEDISKLAKAGMAKINFGEMFRFNYIKYFNACTDEIPHSWHAWKIMREVKDRLKTDMKTLIEALGSDGKA